jgi:hypothetical protein
VSWPPPAFSPDTGLFYVQEHNGFNILYLTDPDPRGSMGLGGKTAVAVGSAGNALSSIDYKTGKTVWRHPWPRNGGGGAGMLTSAGKVVFTGDGSGNFVAFDAKAGKPVWHSRVGNPSNAPQTYMIDGRQRAGAVGDWFCVYVVLTHGNFNSQLSTLKLSVASCHGVAEWACRRHPTAWRPTTYAVLDSTRAIRWSRSEHGEVASAVAVVVRRHRRVARHAEMAEKWTRIRRGRQHQPCAGRGRNTAKIRRSPS